MWRPTSIVLAIALALGAVEALAYGWMHPAPSGLGQPVLCYRPSRSAGVPPASDPSYSAWNRNHAEEKTNIEHRTSNIQRPTTDKEPASTNSPTDNRQPTTDNSSSSTPLPELYAQSAPMLRCSSGQVFRVDLEAPLTLHLAYFAWDDTDTGSVLEAFRHMPEACLGSIGMTLISKEPPLLYQVGGETLTFDHTVFRDSGQTAAAATLGTQVHAFRAVWVTDMTTANARQGVTGLSIERLRTLRIHSALSRFRPAHARVIQGAVRGATTPDLAWQAFKDTMLVDLSFESYPKEGRTPIRPAQGSMIQAP